MGVSVLSECTRAKFYDHNGLPLVFCVMYMVTYVALALASVSQHPSSRNTKLQLRLMNGFLTNNDSILNISMSEQEKKMVFTPGQPSRPHSTQTK